MEPGHEDREYAAEAMGMSADEAPQWSPVMKTGNTDKALEAGQRLWVPQWSPVMKTGNTPPS